MLLKPHLVLVCVLCSSVSGSTLTLTLTLTSVLTPALTSVLTPVLETSQGQLRGFRSPLTGQYKFFGIPYAVAKRFQPPEAAPRWKGTLNALNPLSTCPQAVSYLLLGTEDCLHLDVHTPGVKRKPEHKLPVMVFFHGGAYYHGAKYHYDPEFLVTHDVIVVVVNYRLGVLGFLCIHGTANLGIKDQIEALRWVQKNIAHFGGDEENVTLFGQSAGASAAGMHLLTDASKGLFHKVILQSGTPLSPWAFNVDSVTPAVEDAKKIGAKTDEPKEAYEVFLNASLYQLLTSTKDTSINPKHFKYAPCIDRELFLDAPYYVIKSRNYSQVPVIVGTTDVEGLLFYGLHNKRTLEDFDVNFEKKLPSVFGWCSAEERKMISSKLRYQYFGRKTINETLVNEIKDFYSDFLVYSSSSAFAGLMAATSSAPVYSYLFSYEGERNFGKFIFTPNTSVKGASHSDDIFYLFKPLGLRMILTTADKTVIDRMSLMWTNFAKTGNPTPAVTRVLPVRWLPVTSDSSRVLKIDRTLRMVPLPQEYRGRFLHQLLCEYGQQGFVPCDSRENCGRQ